MILPFCLATKIHECARAVAVAMKAAYSCDGISTRQHNKPDGGQDVWHYHHHAFPRYKGDQLYTSQRALVTADERYEYARELRTQCGDWTPSV
jgi:histidine triad (HIT) family protein